MTETIQSQQTAVRPAVILYGRKTTMFAIEQVDVPHLVSLHHKDTRGMMLWMCLSQMTEDEATRYITMMLVTGQIRGWSVYTLHGRKSTCIGFIYLMNLTVHSATVVGIMDSHVIRGLGRHLKEGTYTFAEDASRAVINHCFDSVGLHRLETIVRSDNRRALLLDKRVGWKIEGTMREAYLTPEGPKDVVILSILRKDWQNER